MAYIFLGVSRHMHISHGYTYDIYSISDDKLHYSISTFRQHVMNICQRQESHICIIYTSMILSSHILHVIKLPKLYRHGKSAKTEMYHIIWLPSHLRHIIYLSYKDGQPIYISNTQKFRALHREINTKVTKQIHISILHHLPCFSENQTQNWYTSWPNILYTLELRLYIFICILHVTLHILYVEEVWDKTEKNRANNGSWNLKLLHHRTWNIYLLHDTTCIYSCIIHELHSQRHILNGSRRQGKMVKEIYHVHEEFYIVTMQNSDLNSAHWLTRWGSWDSMLGALEEFII